MRVPGLIDVGTGSGPPLVCLHGFLGCAEDFRALFEDLGKDRRCIAFDLPGHGSSPGPARLPTSGPVFEATCALVLSWIEATTAAPVDVLGYSMGGRLAFGLLATASERIRRAVVLGANPGLEDEEDRARRRVSDAMLADRLLTEPLDTFLDAWYAQPLFDGLRASPVFPAVLARRQQGDPERLSRALRGLGLGEQPSFWRALGAREEPLLLIAGADDAKYVRMNRSTRAACPGAEAVVITEAGHAVHLEQPEAFARSVRSFLDAP